MGDLFDQASEIEEMFRDAAIAAARQPARLKAAACWNCQEHLEPPRFNFCDPDCRSDYEARTGSRNRTLRVELDPE